MAIARKIGSLKIIVESDICEISKIWQILTCLPVGRLHNDFQRTEKFHYKSGNIHSRFNPKRLIFSDYNGLQ